MAFLIEEKRFASPTSSAQVNAVIGPTAGMVINRSTPTENRGCHGALTGTNFEDNSDEYEPEARTILPRLRSCHSADDVLQVVYAEFVR